MMRFCPMTIYDFVFVLPTFSKKYPSGGQDIVYRLASGLIKRKFKVAIVFTVDPYKYVQKYIPDNNLTKMEPEKQHPILRRLIYGGRFTWVYRNWHMISKFVFKNDYDYSILKKVDFYLVANVEDLNLKFKRIVATAWSTAYFVKEILEKVSDVEGYYFIQNSEDDPSFSSQNSKNASDTYDFNLKKIVINRKLYERFHEEEPLFLHIGIDTEFYKLLNPIKKRDFDVLFPFRYGESKGFRIALDSIQKLIGSNLNIKISAYGNVKKEHIPGSILSSISYSWFPTRYALRELYNNSKIFILPSLVEGMPSPPLEAMSCGAAVISTDNGGSNEYLVNNENGIICPTNNSDCLFEKTLRLLENNSEMDILIHNGFKTSKKFSYENMVEEFVRIMGLDSIS